MLSNKNPDTVKNINTDTDINIDTNENINDIAAEKLVQHGVSDETRIKANRYFISKMVLNACLVVLGAIIITSVLGNLQHMASIARQRESSSFTLNETAKLLKTNVGKTEDAKQLFHDCNQDILEDIELLIAGNAFSQDAEGSGADLSEISEDRYDLGINNIYILSKKGNVLFTSDESLSGKNIVDAGVLSEENYGQLTKGTVNSDGVVEPVLEDCDDGAYYFYYSMPVKYAGKSCMLAINVESSLLASQIGSLNDVAATLDNADVENGGFIFAVDKESATYMYFPQGDEDLTGQSIADSGLTERALDDGYAGTVTINGSKYYCVSKAYTDDIILCAAAPISEIYRYDRKAIFWTVAAFLAVMLLCLLYAIIVRNDFVRNAVDTKRKVFRKNAKNPIIFDMSVFNKVAPLMISGVLVLLGISFYTQTLIEVSRAGDRAAATLEDAAERYTAIMDDREVVSYYYNNRFIAKAKMIANLIEEDPSVLNESTDRYYSDYDKNGEKVFVRDDEGGRLRSVGESTGLRELCNVNSIDAIYVFDEDGRTIATNTINWFTTISHDKKDSSYKFLDVFDGKKDVYIQDSAEGVTADMGDSIGVGFNYYTKKGANGVTEYVSKREYERNPAGISRHHSMVQIELNRNLSDMLMASADFSSVLPAKKQSGEFVMTFDKSKKHNCLYSPKDAYVGKTAKELGISPNAFTGNDYYGFVTIDEKDCFQFARYYDGYYMSSFAPRAGVFHYRPYLTLATSLASLIMLLIILGTVTLTTREEELLYMSMSDDKAAEGMDSAIFSIILPSGRRTSTTKAAARWDNRSIPWSVRTPEQKLLILVSVLSGLLLICLLVRVNLATSTGSSGSIVNYILGGNWDRGPNVFALTVCALVLIATAIIITLFRIPVRLITALLGARGETIGHLLMSVMRYGGVIGAFFYGLYLLGIDSRGLLASAGILTLVVGLGAQSLIKDILAGIFIVFEGEFRVGDIVTINDYRGTVMDIGLRTTKILGVDGNIKIYNNSEITGVLNMTREASYAVARINIEYGQDIDYVEAVLDRELPTLKEDNSKILDGPDYLGIAELGESGITLLVGCTCSEADLRSVTRYLNKALLQIFYRNDISVPFTQITISQRDAEGRKTVEDLIEEKLQSMEED